MQIIAEITYTCPCNCVFCPIRKLGLKGTMQLNDYTLMLKVFAEYFDDELAVVLSGGEPSTMHNLRDYVKTAKRIGYTVTIATNASNPETIVNAEPDLIEVSIDYMGKRHDINRGVKGLFEKAMRLLDLADQNGIATVVRATVVNDNIDDLIKLKEKLSVPIIAMPVKGVKQLKPSKQQLVKLHEAGVTLSDHCPAGLSSFVITPQREILACIFYRKKLGQFKWFLKSEIEKAVKEGQKLPRFPCEK